MLGHRALNVEDYMAILKRHWWLIAIPTFIVPVLAVVATFYIPPQYVSQTLVLIDQQKVPENFVPSVVTEDINSRLASMKEQILSRSSIQPIIEKFDLYADQHLSMDDRITLARKNIDIQPITSEIARSNGLPGFKIFFTASDAHTAQEVCAEITTLFTGANLRSRSEAAEGTTDFLKEQLDSAKRTLDDQDAKLAAFQREHFGMLPEDEASNINILSTLNTQLDASTQALSRMEQDKSYMETMLAQQAASSPGAASPQSDEKELQDLLAQQANLTSRYSADYPDVIAINRKIADLRRQDGAVARRPILRCIQHRPRPQRLRRRAGPARAHPRRRHRNPGQARRTGPAQQADPLLPGAHPVQPAGGGGVQGADPRHTDLAGLVRQRSHQAEPVPDGHRPRAPPGRRDIQPADEANLPDSPTFPKRRIFASGGLAGGLVLGLLLTALLEYRDTALRSERDVWAFTKLPTLAVIAWSGDVAERKPGKLARLKRPFRRKPKEPTRRSPGITMYKSFFHLDSTPFADSPDPRFLVRMAHTREALATLEYGIGAHKGFIVLTGEVGTGKTTLLRAALASFEPGRVFSSFVFNPRLEVLDFFEFILADFGIVPQTRTKSGMLIQLNRWLVERFRHDETCVIVIDEAQNLTWEQLEEVRLLTNLETPTRKLVQIVLSGQPELEEKLTAPDLRQLRQRIALWARTHAISADETSEYITQRLLVAGSSDPIFLPDAVAAIHRASCGIPRIINLICEQALILAYVEQLHQVPAPLIHAVVRDLDLDPQSYMVYSSRFATPTDRAPASLKHTRWEEGGDER